MLSNFDLDAMHGREREADSNHGDRMGWTVIIVALVTLRSESGAGAWWPAQVRQTQMRRNGFYWVYSPRVLLCFSSTVKRRGGVL